MYGYKCLTGMHTNTKAIKKLVVHWPAAGACQNFSVVTSKHLYSDMMFTSLLVSLLHVSSSL